MEAVTNERDRKLEKLKTMVLGLDEERRQKYMNIFNM